MSRREEIAARWAKASRGQWYKVEWGQGAEVWTQPDDAAEARMVCDVSQHLDAEAIAHAPGDIAWLDAALTEALAEVGDCDECACVLAEESGEPFRLCADCAGHYNELDKATQARLEAAEARADRMQAVVEAARGVHGERGCSPMMSCPLCEAFRALDTTTDEEG